MSKRTTRFPRVTVCGLPCRQTSVTLAALLRAGVPVTGLVLARRSDRARSPGIAVPAAPWSDDPAAVAQRSNIPVVVLESKHDLEVLSADALPAAECAVVSCFPWKLPARLIERYPLGMFNLHPSPLPEYPGPAPLFWQYRDGRLRTGVTIHQVTEDLDAGPVVGRVVCTLPLAFPGDRLEAWLAWYGCGLLIAHWQATPHERMMEQPNTQSSWARVPGTADRTIDVSWPAWQVVHFLGGVLPLGYEVFITDRSDQLWRIWRFLAWTAEPLVPEYDGRRLSILFGRSWITVEATVVHPPDRVLRNTLRQ